MSKQLIDTVQRILNSVFLQIDKRQYKKALDSLEKAEKLLEKVNMPDFLCQALMLKGRALFASGRQEEALAEFQRMLELSVPRFFEDAKNSDYQYFIYNAIGFTVKTLREMGDASKTNEFFFRNEKDFERILAAYEELLAEEPDNYEYIRNYLKTQENIMAYYFEANQFEKYTYLMSKVVQYYEKALESESEDIEELYDNLDRHLMMFKRYCLIFCKLGEAKEVFEQAEKIYRRILEKEPENSMAFDNLISLYEESGDLYAKLQDIGKAEEALLKASELYEEKLKKQPDDIDYTRNQSEILRNLSRSFYAAEDTEKAEQYAVKADQYAVKAFETIKELPGKKPDDLDFQFDIADDFNELGELFREIGDFDHAKESRRKEIEIYENIHENDPEDLLSVENMAAAYDQMGHLYTEERKMEPAKHYYELGMKTYKKMLESDPENLDLEIGVADSLDFIGELYRFTEPETARDYFEKALAINEKAVRLSPEIISYKEDLISTLKDLSSLNVEQKQFESAIQVYERITEIRRELAEENPEVYKYEKSLGDSYSELGLLLERTGKLELAKQQYSKAGDIFREILQKEEESASIRILLLELKFHALFLIFTKKYFIAREFVNLIRDYSEELYATDPETPSNWEGLIETRFLDANLQEHMKNYGMAVEIYESILPALQKHYESDTENPEYLEKVNFAYTHLGIIYLLTDAIDKSKEAFEKALPIGAKLLEIDPDYRNYIRDVTETFEEYVKLLKKLGRNEEAEEYNVKVEGLREKLKKEELDEEELDENKGETE